MTRWTVIEVPKEILDDPERKDISLSHNKVLKLLGEASSCQV